MNKIRLIGGEFLVRGDFKDIIKGINLFRLKYNFEIIVIIINGVILGKKFL